MDKEVTMLTYWELERLKQLRREQRSPRAEPERHQVQIPLGPPPSKDDDDSEKGEEVCDRGVVIFDLFG